jgi:hypothetical protein
VGMQAKDLLRSLPADWYGLVPYALAPVLGNPIAMAAHGIASGASPLAQLEAVAAGLQKQLPLLGALTTILPQDTLLWKLGLLQTGCEYLDSVYCQVRLPQRTACC